MKYDDIIRHIKNERISAAVKTAAEMYLRDGIGEAKMTDIADQAQIGVASLYRYFGTKQLFTIKVGAYIWSMTLKELEPIYTGMVYEAKTGLEQVKTLLNIFPLFLEKYRPFLRFLTEFDMFVIKEHLSQEHLAEYEQCSLNIMPVMVSALKKGAEDGTVRADVDGNVFYHTVTDALLSMCQRFAWGNVPNMENQAMNRKALQMAIEIFLGYIEKK